MKAKILTALFAAALWALIGCSTSSALDKTQTYDGVSWEVNSSWVESKSTSDSLGNTYFTYSNTSNTEASDYQAYLSVFFENPQRYSSPEETLDLLANLVDDPSYSFTYEKIESATRNNAEISLYATTETVNGDVRDKVYYGFVIKPGQLYVELISPDGSLIGPILDNLRVD